MTTSEYIKICIMHLRNVVKLTVSLTTLNYVIGGNGMYRITNTNLGIIDISEEVVETVAGIAAVACYGLVGMSPTNIQSGISSILGIDNIRKGVTVVNGENGLIIDVNVIVGYGIKINEVAKSVMQRVTYVVEKNVGLSVERVNVNVRGVKVIGEK